MAPHLITSHMLLLYLFLTGSGAEVSPRADITTQSPFSSSTTIPWVLYLPSQSAEMGGVSRDEPALGKFAVCYEFRESEVPESPIYRFPVKIPEECKDYCLLIKTCISFSFLFHTGTCLLLDTNLDYLSGPASAESHSSREAVWGEPSCFEVPQTILSLKQVFKKSAPVLINNELTMKCLEFTKIGSGLGWGKCDTAETWLIEPFSGGQPGGFVRISLASVRSLCITYNTSQDGPPIHVAYLMCCTEGTSQLYSQRLIITSHPDPKLYMITDRNEAELFLSENPEGSTLDFMVFLSSRKKLGMCKSQEIRALNGRVQNEGEYHSS